MSSPVVVRNLSKVFYDEGRGEIKAVDSISFECHEGEVFGLLGSNGAGKTTTLRMLSTILSPTSGTATLMGNDVVTNPEGVRKNLGFYSATTALYPRLTTRETIDFFARINQYPADQVEQRVEYLIRRFDLTKYADARIEKLSSGMKQKVSIARTIAHNPPILIFDEPTVGLDVLNALDVQESIRELRSEGKTIIFSTHIMSEAERVCDRIAIVNGGRILACDTLEALRESTQQHYLEDIFVRFVKAGQATA
ncbi:MAG TPA: ABC transporter ATP-binding protein [Pyrinomonadaceae bacterium]|nr:ABC transporter ATP-binding protein [Pyrinomonadaceae bacterium]